MVMISERPAEAADRAVPGHWEGDLVIGKDCRSAVGTLVERATRYVLLLHLPGGRDAHLVEQAMRQAITTLPGQLTRTITWDQGKEMAYHADFTIATGIPVYFCDPTSPGSADPTRTPTGCCASTCPKAPTSRCTPPLTLLASPVASTTGPARPSAT
jgi:transposase, IS30 family